MWYTTVGIASCGNHWSTWQFALLGVLLAGRRPGLPSWAAVADRMSGSKEAAEEEHRT